MINFLNLLVDIPCNYLDLSMRDLGDDEASDLAKALERSSESLTSLDLSHNHFGERGIRLILQPLMYNTSITSLNFSYNCLGEGLFQFQLPLSNMIRHKMILQ